MQEMNCSFRLSIVAGLLAVGALALPVPAAVQAAIPGHAIENVGTSDCKLIMFEPK